MVSDICREDVMVEVVTRHIVDLRLKGGVMPFMPVVELLFDVRDPRAIYFGEHEFRVHGTPRACGADWLFCPPGAESPRGVDAGQCAIGCEAAADCECEQLQTNSGNMQGSILDARVSGRLISPTISHQISHWQSVPIWHLGCEISHI